MKKITQLFLLLVVVFVTACNNTPKIVYLTDYLAKDQMEIDAMPAIREALDYCREVKAEKLVLPKGTLCIKADKAYEKYHNSGLEIYQVGLDEDEFQWKQSAKNLPWITVYNPSTTGADLLMKYNVQALPATFIIANGELAKRVTDVTAISSDIAAHL